MALPEGFSRFPLWRRLFGRRSEKAASKFLRRQRFRIIGQNVEDRLGEIDILAIDGESLVVVEVRSSATKTFDEIAMTVDRDKQTRLTHAVLRFLQKRKLLGKINVRFDVLAIRWPDGARKAEIRHYRDAFESTGRNQMQF